MDDRTITTAEEVIRLAREAGFQTGMMTHVANPWPIVQPCVGTNCFVELTRLIELVKAEENESCAKVCENEACGGSAFNSAAKYMAERIRARRK